MNVLKHCFGLIILLSISVTATAKDKSEILGDAIYILSPAIAYGSTFYKDDPEGRMQFYKSILTNTAVTFGLKYSIKKQRPNGENNRSFPSGHTSTSFQSAAFLHRRYGLKAAIPLYLGASYVAYNRVDSKNHYTEDVLAGALIGGLSSYYFTSAYKPQKQLARLTPILSTDTIGLQLTAHW
jgi:membrane-associated phospholipid phosphatase